MSTRLGALLLSLIAIEASAEAKPQPCPDQRLFVFSWPLDSPCAPNPRGGTTQGVQVVLDLEPSREWRALQAEDISDLERDRRAILAMTGPYRTTFNFIETVGFEPNFKPDVPYQSWATEYVYVLANEPRFISLQHIMVMVFQTEEGKSEPMVMKHWRQDWTYEDRDLLVYRGNDTFQRERRGAKAVKGTWSQAVYQVDDSPRYEAIGRWQHEGNLSTWISERTWRPLPRREHSVRDDYAILEGFNRHTILPTGWVHEEENWKRVSGQGEARFISKEIGVNRYERIRDFDFEPGRKYWEAAGPYWAAVRAKWGALERAGSGIKLAEHETKTPLFAIMLDGAQAYATADNGEVRAQHLHTLAAEISKYVTVISMDGKSADAGSN